MTSSQISAALDAMFERPQGLYGSFDEIPVISQAGHARRVELLEALNIGDVSPMTIVDFGMGSWGFGSVFPKLHGCKRAIGMDVSNAALRMTRELVASSRPAYADRFETYQSDGMDLPLESNSVDLFFSGESIEHVKFPPRYLSEIHRALRPGGQLVVTTPNREAIRYKEQDEEYCTSPEHFWLFSTSELVEAVSEFFDIVEIYGFNGSFGSHEEDRAINDRAAAEAWSRQFRSEPEKATGVVLRATPKAGLNRTYIVEDVPKSAVRIEGAQTYLPLEFGLNGLLLDSAEALVSITRPPGDGIVCRFWCHRWSGMAKIESGQTTDVLDLYTKVPGWRNWVSWRPASDAPVVRVSPTMERNPKAEAAQVIYFEAFSFVHNDAGDTKTDPLLEAATLAAPPVILHQPGHAFAKFDRIVSATVFHWFTPTDGNVRGPWRPIGGRGVWDGSVSFWRAQIKEMMLANIDAIYLHLIPVFEDQRVTFFKAFSELRAEGWDVPKVAPFLDPFGIWTDTAPDLATEAGQTQFCEQYVRFFSQYFDANRDPAAADYLLTIDGRLALVTWWVSMMANVDKLDRSVVEDYLRRALGDKVPQLQSGIWMITTALIDPDLSFSDERAVMFSGYAYAIHSVHNGIDVWHVQPGYWDQNIRKPGYLLPRDGGKNYRRAWDIIAANMPYVGRVYIESWNEYDEGSGIYAADPAGLLVDPNMHSNTDIFSDENNPYEYVLTTANGAARVNGRPDLDAKFLWSEYALVEGHTEIVVTAIVRNEGNTRWSTSEHFEIVALLGRNGRAVMAIDDGHGQATVPWRGIVRGQPVTFRMRLALPVQAGAQQVHLSVAQKGIVFGDRLTLTIDPALA